MPSNSPPYSYARYVSTAETTFAINFDYLSSSHLSVSINGDLQSASTYTIDTSANTVTFNTATSTGQVILISRTTPKGKAGFQSDVADFSDGSVLTAADLDQAALGLLYVAQEADDGGTTNAINIDQTDQKFDANNSIIKNILDPTEGSEAVNKSYVDGLALYNSPTPLSVYTFTGNNSVTAFTMAPAPPSNDPNALIIDIGGVTQKPTNDYTVQNGVITFGTAPPAQTITVRNIGVARDILGENPTVAGNLTVTGAISGPMDNGTVKSTGSTTARSLATRFSEVINVKDYGAVGNGTTNDAVAIQAAMNALTTAGGGVLLFPEGEYAVESKCSQSSCGGPFIYKGEDATIKCTSSSIIDQAVYIAPGNNDCTIIGITIDGNNKANDCLRVVNLNQDGASLTIQHCNFKNSYSADASGNNGFIALGGWDKVVVNNCAFTDHTRAAGAGNPALQGTSGCVVSVSGGYYPRFTSVQDCHFENILNGDTGSSANNVDTDGLKIFGGNTAGTDYIACTSTVSNNYFRNCKGRSIKIQQDEATVIANNFVRNILPSSGGFSEVNLQISSGEVSSNKFHYDEVPGTPNLSPFQDSGTSDYDSILINFYSGTTDERVGMVTVSNNTVYNNVDPSIGNLGVFLECSSSGAGNDYNFDRVITATNNKSSGTLDRFISTSENMGTGKQYITATDNYVKELNTSFISMNDGGDYDKNYITLTGNINSGSVKPASWYIASSVIPAANYSVTNCVGLVEDSTTTEHLQARTGKSFASRINALAPDVNSGGLITILSATIEDDGVWYPPKRGVFGYGVLRILSVAFNESTTGLFSDSGSATAPINFGNQSGSASLRASKNIKYIDEGGAEEDGKVNIWRNTTEDTIGIRNKLGSSRIFTLVTIG